jgi:3-(3-hydroxy-phenyl)propionate hydroxylase
MKYKPKPFYHEGFLLPAGHAAVGRMLPQPLLELADGSRRLLDDIAGNGFALVAYGPDAQTTLDWARQTEFGLGEMPHIAVLPMRMNPDRDHDDTGIILCRDVEDRMAPIARGGAEGDHLLLVRPDRYVAAACIVQSAPDVNRLASNVRALNARTRDGEIAPAGAAARVAASIKP